MRKQLYFMYTWGLMNWGEVKKYYNLVYIDKMSLRKAWHFISCKWEWCYVRIWNQRGGSQILLFPLISKIFFSAQWENEKESENSWSRINFHLQKKKVEGKESQMFWEEITSLFLVALWQKRKKKSIWGSNSSTCGSTYSRIIEIMKEVLLSSTLSSVPLG